MATYQVSNQSQLNSALTNVDDGDTILLQSGNYSSIEMRSGRRNDYNFDQKVTIASASSNNKAEINEIMLANVSNIEFKDLVFDYERGQSSNKPFFVEYSEDLTFDGIDFEGDIRNGYGSGLGLRVKESQDVTVKNSEFRDFGNATDFSNSEDITLTDNVLENMSNDGFTFAGITRMLIEDNTFRDFDSPNPASLHKDIIQFRAVRNEDISRDVIIRDNSIDSAEVRHAIYVGNESYKAGDLYAMHRNFLIEDNYIRSAHLHGITMLHGNGVVIRDNTLVQNDDQGFDRGVNQPLINVSIFSHDVEITGNRVASVQREQDSSWDVSGNFVGSKQYLHWAGTYGFRNGPNTSRIESSASTFTTSEREVSETEAGEAVMTSLDGDLVDGGAEIEIVGADFSRGDVFVFTDWNARTFVDNNSRNAVHDSDNRSSVRVDSALDLQELAHFSSAITAETREEDLIFTIDQGDKGVAEIEFVGLADDFRAADQPELF